MATFFAANPSVEQVELILTVAILILGLIAIIFYISRLKKCPADKIMVIFGAALGKNSDGTTRSAVCMHGGARFVWPLIQRCEFLDLNPLNFELVLKKCKDKDNNRINIEGKMAVGISTEPEMMQNAAERLLGLRQLEIQELAKDIAYGIFRLAVSEQSCIDISDDWDKFLDTACAQLEQEYRKIGLRLISVNLTDDQE